MVCELMTEVQRSNCLSFSTLLLFKCRCHQTLIATHVIECFSLDPDLRRSTCCIDLPGTIVIRSVVAWPIGRGDLDLAAKVAKVDYLRAAAQACLKAGDVARS